MTACFTPRTLTFLRALKRNNDREWFKARRETYERDVRGPMIAVIERLAADLPAFAPDLLVSPQASLYRIYRDTRFSEDKTPLKTHVAAVFPHRALPKHGGAGMYFHLALDGVWIGGGLYAPQTSELQRLREHIAANHRRLRAIIESPSFKKRVGALDGEKLLRMPRGFAADHPAAELLKFKQFLAGKELPAAFATSPRFYSTLIGVFQDIAPLILFLNEPLLKKPGLKQPGLMPQGPKTLGPKPLKPEPLGPEQLGLRQPLPRPATTAPAAPRSRPRASALA